ncbi:MAG: hypothetical protein E7099_05420 [Mediterranea massiliensis]|nr:hypothetical protein [Mediterranea massiliensis]
MKTNYLFLLLLSCFIISCENEEPPINLETIQGKYSGDKLQFFYNGEEMITPEEYVTLELNDPNSSTITFIAHPFWPEVRDFKNQPPSEGFKNIRVDLEAVPTATEVILKGSYQEGNYYRLDIEAKWIDGNLEAHLNYTATNEKFINNSFVIQFDEEALDFTHLTPHQPTVEYEGEIIPIKEFVKDAMSPILRVLNRNFGNELRLDMLENGDMTLSAKIGANNSFTQIPGIFRYRIHRVNYGYFEADPEGALWIYKAFKETDFPGPDGDGIVISNIRRTPAQHFTPIFYYFDNNDFIFAINSIGTWFSYRLLTGWLDNPTQQTLQELTTEEKNKFLKFTKLIAKDIIKGNICIRAEKQ